jgi:acyl-CoA synthetase (AMP-forming)/AMP-acid ligase II
LLHGGTCVVYAERLPDLQKIGKALDKHRVSCLWLTASLFDLVIDQGPQILAGVRYLLTGGEALSVRHVRLALAKLPQTRLVNGYGPTEGTTFTCCYPLPSSLPPDLASVPIGRPLANTRAYILDETQQLLPIGVAGELYIGGEGLARGYWNRPEQTAERFLPDPFATDSGARMYRSGDRCRWLPDGNLEFLGRIDHQVKIRGFRIELGEIEAVLGQHPAVREAVVVAREDTREEPDVAENRKSKTCTEPSRRIENPKPDKQLTAYVVPQLERPSPEELRGYLAEQLPEYMVPSAFVILDTLPLTASGKVDRAALPAPPPRSFDDFAPPATPLEADIVAVWKNVLGIAGIGLDDNFFDLGGTSLSLMQAHNRLTGHLRLDLSIVDLFDHPTVRSLARRISCGDANPPPHAAAERALRQRHAFEEQRRRRQ